MTALKRRVEPPEDDQQSAPADGTADPAVPPPADAPARSGWWSWIVRHWLIAIACFACFLYIELLVLGLIVQWERAREDARRCPQCEIALTPRWTGEVIVSKRYRIHEDAGVHIDFSDFLTSARLQDLHADRTVRQDREKQRPGSR